MPGMGIQGKFKESSRSTSVCVVFGPRPHYKNRVWLGRTAQVITMVLVLVLASKMVGAVASLAKLVSLGHW